MCSAGAGPGWGAARGLVLAACSVVSCHISLLLAHALSVSKFAISDDMEGLGEKVIKPCPVYQATLFIHC